MAGDLFIPDKADPEILEYSNKFWSTQPDAKDFGPSWLDGVQGSTAEERQLNSDRKKKELILERKRVNSLLKGTDCSLKALATDPKSINIKLSECWARCPSAHISLGLNLQKVTESNSKKLRSFLIWYYRQKSISDEARILIELELDRILTLEVYSNSKIHKENLIIRQSFLILEPEQAWELIESFYTSSNLSRWFKTGEFLALRAKTVLYQSSIPKEKIRRRGYRESHSNKHKSIDGRKLVNMDESTRTLEEIKQSILKKQALLFEQRLDRYLRIGASETSPEQRKQIFNSLLENQDSSEILDLKDQYQRLEEINLPKFTPKGEEK